MISLFPNLSLSVSLWILVESGFPSPPLAKVEQIGAWFIILARIYQTAVENRSKF